MRMWPVEPENLCNQHLLGEHFELHKFRHMFVKKQDVSTRMRKNQIFPNRMQERHDELVDEMQRRGIKHNSQYEQPDVSYCYKDSKKLSKR